MDSLIELQSVTVHAKEYISLDEVSVAFPANRSTLIMGPSGRWRQLSFRPTMAGF